MKGRRILTDGRGHYCKECIFSTYIKYYRREYFCELQPSVIAKTKMKRILPNDDACYKFIEET